jgi:thiamine biosynthesis lipoprotein
MAESSISAEFPAWGGRTFVALYDPAAGDLRGGLESALAAVHAIIDATDTACSSFRQDSEIAAVNRCSGEAVKVGPLLLEHVEAALRAAQLTDGDVDPTVGEALVAFGFGVSDGQPQSRPEIRAVPGYRTVAVDRDAGTIRTARGVRLDLGATAKALAADQAAAAAHQASGGAGVLVSLSGDLSIAGPPPPEGWRVRVTDDHRAEVTAPGQWISLRDGGLATSSTTVRALEGDRTQHHVIDPHSGRPAPVHFRTVSVAAASCLDANIASTAAIVRGGRAAGWLQTLGLPSRLVLADGSARHVAGWPDDGEDLPVVAEQMLGAA